MTDGLVDDETLHASAVVANCAMNRERQLVGVNSYTRELGFNPVDWLIARINTTSRVGWLDPCCGSGRALHQAATHLADSELSERAALIGVDLVDAFEPVPPHLAQTLRYQCASVPAWQPPRSFDLITCSHGLHYVGDKLAVLTQAASWLTDDGLLVADLDLTAVRLGDGRPAGRPLSTALRAAGFRYDARRRRVSRTGGGPVELPYAYLGADDHAGPNYTGQPAVNSHYRRRG